MAMKIVPVCLVKPTEVGPASQVAPPRSYQTSYLLLLTSPSECVFASHVPPMEAVPEHAALPVMISEDVPEQPAPAQY